MNMYSGKKTLMSVLLCLLLSVKEFFFLLYKIKMENGISIKFQWSWNDLTRFIVHNKHPYIFIFTVSRSAFTRHQHHLIGCR